MFTSLYKHTIGRVLPLPPKPGVKINASKKRKRDCDDDKESISVKRMVRAVSEPHKEVITKRRRVDADRFAPIVDGEIYESTSIATLSETCEAKTHPGPSLEQNRTLMLPPALSPLKLRGVSRIMNLDRRRDSMELEDVSQLSLSTRANQQRPADDFNNDYDMERARRYAAATTLPAKSGIWERGEKELFFHLSYRGFEPVFPQNWMSDFRTMPLSLFPSDGEDAPAPLIRVHKPNGEFRAIRELRELIDLGRNVRDKVLSSPRGKREAVIEKATRKHINWALNDVGIKLSTSSVARTGPLPIHVVVKLKARQTTGECLAELKTKMHALRSQHYHARNIQESIERDTNGYGTPESQGKTRVVEDLDNDIPVLYGLVICSSILSIFTLNSHVPPPRKTKDMSGQPVYGSRMSPAVTESALTTGNESTISVEVNTRLKQSLLSSMVEEEEFESDAASDPHFIGDFDFSNPASDVWNALVIAIVAMQVRQDMKMLEENVGIDESLDNVRAGIEESSIMEFNDDDPDA